MTASETDSDEIGVAQAAPVGYLASIGRRSMNVGDLVESIPHGRGIILDVKNEATWVAVWVFWEEPIFWKKDLEDARPHVCWVDEASVRVISATSDDKDRSD